VAGAGEEEVLVHAASASSAATTEEVWIFMGPRTGHHRVAYTVTTPPTPCRPQPS
jgi:hypothetical protein